MSSSYEFWLTDDSGKKMLLFKNLAYVSYCRTTNGYGTIQLGLPFNDYVKFVPFVFQPDWRIDVFRSPESGLPKRRECSFLLRKFRIYDRTTDSMRMIEFFGRSPIDILRRWSVVSYTISYYKKTDQIDDMMKAIVTQSFITTPMVAPTGELTVEGNVSLGPIVTLSFFGKVVLEILRDLKATSFSLNATDPTSKKIYFDVVEGNTLSNGGFGYLFKTYAGLRGTDRTSNLVFSVENGNIQEPQYYEDYLDQVTEGQVGTTVVDGPDIYLSRWNKIMVYRGITESPNFSTSVDEKTALANKILAEGAKDVSFNATFLNTPGSPVQPRSLYGVDWDLGDLLSVKYAGRAFESEVKIVYVSLEEDGKENVIGMSSIGE